MLFRKNCGICKKKIRGYKPRKYIAPSTGKTVPVCKMCMEYAERRAWPKA
ncbi:hypothetical protein [Salibacterium aidingense]|nr:hypothetical protein [Salibacterium aidingense]